MTTTSETPQTSGNISSPIRTLIVDDSFMFLECLRELLITQGHVQVLGVAANGNEALDKAAKLTPDLVLMDFSLPGMDGLSATKNLKADPATRHLAVVGLTANAMKGDEQIALNAGCDGYLTKPIDTRTFVATVKNFIASGNLRQTKK